LVNINLGQFTTGQEMRIRLSDYIDMSLYKNLKLLSGVNSVANLLTDEVVIYSSTRGTVQVSYQAEYLDGSFTNIATITGLAVPPYAVRLFNAVANTTKVGDSLTYELGYLTSVSSVQWYACNSSAVEAKTNIVPAGCSAVARASSPTLVLTNSQIGKYMRLKVVSNLVTVFSESSTQVYAAPAAVTRLGTTLATNSTTVTWTAAVANSSPVTSYRVRVLNSLGKVVATLTLAGTSTKVVLNKANSTIVRSGKYKVEVTAYNAAGAGKSVSTALFTAK
jgi:hypothetical protein